MDEVLDKLREHGKNDQETILQWMKDAKIIGDKQQENRARQYLRESASSDKVDLNQLKHTLEELAKDRRQSAVDLQAKLSAQSTSLMAALQASLTRANESLTQMDEAFEKLRQQGKNNQETLINWMKEAKVIADHKQEELAKQYFKETAEAKVDMERFKEVIAKVAKETKQSVDDLHENLSAHSVKIMEAVKAGIEAFNKAMRK